MGIIVKYIGHFMYTFYGNCYVYLCVYIVISDYLCVFMCIYAFKNHKHVCMMVFRRIVSMRWFL